MLADAIAAERFRLSRDRVSLFWGFGFAPLAAMLLSMGGDIFVHLVFYKSIAGQTTDLGERAIAAVSGAAEPLGALFLLIGAAAIFAGDYRWETWRLVTPRNSRLNLLAAKLIVFAEAAAWSLLLTAVTAVVAGLFSSVVNHAPIIASTSSFLGRFAGVLLVTWLQTLSIGALAALIGVATRSTLGAVIAGLVIVGVQATLAGLPQPPTWKSLAIPAYAGRLLKTFVAPTGYDRPDLGLAAVGLAWLVVWVVVLGGAAVLLFRRQDLTRE